MLNLEQAKAEFLKYVNKFNLDEKKLIIKKEHCLRVMKISGEIARALDLDGEKVKVAELVGLLHDIGRFEQFVKLGNFHDCKKLDHGDYGVEILKKNNILRKYIDTNKYDKIIEKSIRNHNKYEIEEGLTKEELLFCKIIRDADKIDIFYEGVHIYWEENKQEIENSKLQKCVKDQFVNKNRIDRRTIEFKNSADKIVSMLAFIYDVNFNISFKIIQKEQFINKIIDKFKFEKQETKDDFETIKKVANKYIEEKINKG